MVLEWTRFRRKEQQSKNKERSKKDDQKLRHEINVLQEGKKMARNRYKIVDPLSKLKSIKQGRITEE